MRGGVSPREFILTVEESWEAQLEDLRKEARRFFETQLNKKGT